MAKTTPAEIAPGARAGFDALLEEDDEIANAPEPEEGDDTEADEASDEIISDEDLADEDLDEAPAEGEAEQETPAAEGEAPAADAQPAGEPFVFKVDGKKVEVPGAAVDKETGNITLTKDAWQRVIQPHLADRTAWNQTVARYRQHLKDLDPENNVEVLKARKVVAKLHELQQKGADGVLEFFENLDQHAAQAEAAAKAEALERRNQELESRFEAEASERETEVVTQTFWQSADELVEDTIERQFPELKGADVAQLVAALREQYGEHGLLFKAEEDFLAPWGQEYKQGQFGIRYDLLDAAMQEMALSHQRKQRAQADAEKVRRTATPPAARKAAAPPPKVSAKAAAGQAKREVAITSRADWKNSLMALADDDDE